MISEVGQRRIRRAFPDHQVNRDQALEDDSPGRVPQPVLQRPEDFPNARLTRPRCDQDMLNVLCLWGCSLGIVGSATRLDKDACLRPL